MTKRFALLLSFVLTLGNAPAADKSSYPLFHPVPDAERRDFDPDRPDKTNSAPFIARKFPFEGKRNAK